MADRATDGRSIRGRALALALDGGACRAGGPIGGMVSGADGAATVSLLRVEQSPAGVFAFNVDSCHVEVCDSAARFALTAPAGLPPAAHGVRCRLEYAVSVGWQSSRFHRGRTAEPVTITPRDHPVHQPRSRFDRVIPSQRARHFHVELADAVLEGGGRVTGRVHADARHAGPGFELTATCEEVWCTNHRYRTRRSPLLWEARELWSEAAAAAIEPGAHWAGFRFDLPEGLPPAVEARVIAWRYTIEARPAARRILVDSAMVTPLRFEI